MANLRRVAIFISEFLTTALLVISTCQASANFGQSKCAIALTAGLAQFVLRNCFGQISGAYGNPAISLALWIHRGKMEIIALANDIAAQIAGAAVGYYIASSLIDKTVNDNICTLQPEGTNFNIIAYEFSMTFILVTAWCAILVYKSNSTGALMELYLAFTYALIALLGVVLPGISTNPARTMAPLFVTGKAPKMLLYLPSEFAAAIVCPFLFKKLSKMAADFKRSKEQNFYCNM